jgi:hypothetical protein
MRSKPIGLDWFDLLLHGGITFALAVVGASAMRSQEEFAIGMVVAISLGVLGWRRNRALRHAPALTTGEAQAERVAELETRVAELESQHARVLELEERVDFAERLLTRHAERAAPPLGSGRTED